MEFTTALFFIGLITIVLLMIEVNFTYATQGFGYGWSSNRPADAQFSPLAKRISNSYRNQVESTAYSVPVLASAAFLGLEHNGAETAAMLFVLGRAAYAPLYIWGKFNLRLVGFGVSTLSMLYILFVLGTSGLV